MRDGMVKHRRTLPLLLAGGVLLVAGGMYSLARAESTSREGDAIAAFLEMHGEVSRWGSVPARQVAPVAAPACIRKAQQPAADTHEGARG
jgi:hypothetical protein